MRPRFDRVSMAAAGALLWHTVSGGWLTVDRIWVKE